MATAGPNYCGTGADDAGVGSKAWSNPTNAQSTIDGAYASATKTGTTGTVNDTSIMLVKGGTISSTDKSTGAAWTTGSPAWSSFGSSSDLWGLTLAAADVNASNFGVALSCTIGTQTHWLKCTNFGFSISGTVSGVQAEFYRHAVTEKTSFVAGTLIRTVHGLIPIEEIRKGDLVYSFDKNRNVRLSYVTSASKGVSQKMIVINGKITTTHNHQFYTKRGWVSASNLKNGDEIYTYDYTGWSADIVRSKQSLSFLCHVYNFEVEQDETYFANGFAVHNGAVGGNMFARVDSVRITLTYTAASGSAPRPGLCGGIRDLNGGITQ